MLLDRLSSKATSEAAAARRGYKLQIASQECDSEARFLLIDRYQGEAFPRNGDRCGMRFKPVAQHRMTSLSGMDWTLYERRP